VFEVDQPGSQAWKRQRLVELGFGVPDWLRLVPADFQADDTWWQRLAVAGFDAGKPAVVASSGVSMYLAQEAITAMLRQVAALVPGSTLAMTFLLPLECADPEVRPGRLSSASSRRPRCWPWPAKPALEKPGTCRQTRLPSVTSRAEPMAFDRRTMRRNCWSRRPGDDGISVHPCYSLRSAFQSLAMNRALPPASTWKALRRLRS
jgi:hypothetical protein